MSISSQFQCMITITNRFLSELQEIEWSNLSDYDAKKSFTTFYKKINSLVNKHAPTKTLSKRREKILSKPWITKGIRTSIQIKNSIFLTLIGKIIIIPKQNN